MAGHIRDRGNVMKEHMKNDIVEQQVRSADSKDSLAIFVWIQSFERHAEAITKSSPFGGLKMMKQRTKFMLLVKE